MAILRLWFGILACQSLRNTSDRPFDSRKWIVPGLGLWHLRLNLLRLIHKIHWGGSSPQDSSTLQFAADAWNRSNVNIPNDFAKLEALLLDSHQARIACLMIELGGSQVQRGFRAPIHWLRHRSKAEYELLLNNLVSHIYSPEFRNPTPQDPLDEIKENHLRFIRHMDIYCVLRYAIKHGDIGLLRFALQGCCILFQAKEGNTFNYGPELIRLIHLYTCTKAADVQLQEAMLANSLVNLSGHSTSFFEMDRFLEFLNGRLKDVMRERRSSTKPIDNLLKQIALTIPYTLQLRMTLQTYCGRRYGGKHPKTNIAEDLHMMAIDLWKRDYHKKNYERFSSWVATDLIRSGLSYLGENLSKYNVNTIGRGEWDTNEGDSNGIDDIPDENERPISPTEKLFRDIGF